jgi:hypothetical protein
MRTPDGLRYAYQDGKSYDSGSVVNLSEANPYVIIGTIGEMAAGNSIEITPQNSSENENKAKAA